MENQPSPAPPGSVRSAPRSRLNVPLDTLISELTRRVRAGEQADSTIVARMLGVLAAEIGARPDASDRYSPQASMIHLSNLLGHPDVTRPALPELQGAVCLDFGSGGLNPAGGLFALLLAGAERGIAVDLDDIHSVPCAVRALYNLLCAAITHTVRPAIPGSSEQLLSRVQSFDIARLAAGDIEGIDEQRLCYLQKPLQAAGLGPGSIDLLVSNSVLEHIDDLDPVLAEMARIVRPGGLAVHAIDGYDHRHYHLPREISPHEFLFDASDDVLLHGCNRIRPMQFAARFEAFGFEVRRLEKSNLVPISDADHDRLAPAFRDLPRDHIEVARARYYLRRR